MHTTRRFISLLLLGLALLWGGPTCAQQSSRADELHHQARQSLEQKEYIRARYYFLQAYYAYAASGQCAQATDCGIRASTLYRREGYYKEAFELLDKVTQTLTASEQATGKSLSALQFSVRQERMRMYVGMNRQEGARRQLALMEEDAKAADNDSIDTELYYAQATVAYAFGQTKKGDEALARLIRQYADGQNYDKVAQCFASLVDIGRKANNSALVARMYDKYMAWNDSVNAHKANERYAALQQRFDQSQADIAKQTDALSTRRNAIVALGLLAAVLAAALLLEAALLLRYVARTRKQKRQIDTANEHNALKTRFIQNISAQIAPTLDRLGGDTPSVQALRNFSQHIQELAEVESTLNQPYPTEEKNVALFCENLADAIRPSLAPGATIVVNAPKMPVRIAIQPLERLLMHLLSNAAKHTPEGGKVWLDFKKRGAHTQQFVVTDTGCGIPAERRADLFKPFTSAPRDLAQGDRLGLPLCSLTAIKMNGTLSIDETYTKGTRFVLELHT